VHIAVRGDLTSEISPKAQSAQQGINKEIASQTLDATTQLGIRKIYHPAQRKICISDTHLQCRHFKGMYSADTLFVSTKVN
jgi:hypothetical protein